MENDNPLKEGLSIDEKDELYRLATLAWEESEEEIEEQNALDEYIDTLYANYKENLNNPEFQAYQMDVLRQATHGPDNSFPDQLNLTTVEEDGKHSS